MAEVPGAVSRRDFAATVGRVCETRRPDLPEPHMTTISNGAGATPALHDPLLTPAQAAEAVSLSEQTLRIARIRGNGPKFVKLGASVRYRLSDLEAWIASRVVGSTAEVPTDMRHGLTRSAVVAAE
jgi:predicted DNA-binding transcriptional regulator AlpA